MTRSLFGRSVDWIAALAFASGAIVVLVSLAALAISVVTVMLQHAFI
jgi:hypothetical protein